LRADPSPWLCVSDAIKEKNKAKPYDPKKSVWVPNKVRNKAFHHEGMVVQVFCFLFSHYSDIFRAMIQEFWEV